MQPDYLYDNRHLYFTTRSYTQCLSLIRLELVNIVNKCITLQNWSKQHNLAYGTLISIMDGSYPYNAEVIPLLLIKLNYDVIEAKPLLQVREEALFLVKKRPI